MSDPRALGVFDSGLGGLTVVHALLDALPNERVIYLGDTARVPYGTRSAQTVLRYSRGCAQVLVERQVKALVIACNTASAVAVEMLRAELDLPVIGVIEPGAQAAVSAMDRLLADPSFSGPARIGVLGTQGTIASGAYPRAVSQLSTRYEVVARAAPLLVPLVEEGWLSGDVPRLAVERYVGELIELGAQVLVLGCTHYPLLKPLIAEVAERLAGKPVPVVDGALATADSVVKLIEERRISEALEPGEGARLKLFVTDLPAGFSESARRFLGENVSQVEQIDLKAG
ncbi:MAG: glutamate racemase [Polyangiaceae bacterium]|nr:glutamate racemase [Polyangiaceae bacterium]